MCTLGACQVVEDEVPLPSIQEHSPEFVDLIKQCLEKDPYKRPTAEALLAHPFLRKVAHMCCWHNYTGNALWPAAIAPVSGCMCLATLFCTYQHMVGMALSQTFQVTT